MSATELLFVVLPNTRMKKYSPFIVISISLLAILKKNYNSANLTHKILYLLYCT